ncbi:hypothetical protein LIP_1561 [Limnochorda pilosa]|uniref:Uncharacterized protein n=1 Tax=Limnochorda pilosa TaxID=1555112 RepID=A0A0K2SJW5_LIMPI|nr:hypothetical protein LIP_1561 [Limnochorda pilosa]
MWPGTPGSPPPGEADIKGRLLYDQARKGPNLEPTACGIETEHPHAPGGGLQEPDDELDGGGLASPVGYEV